MMLRRPAASGDLVPLAVAEAPAQLGYRGLVEAREERLLVSPYPLRDTFKAVSASLRTRLYHGASAANPPVEDFGSGTLRARRAYLEGSTGILRLLMGVPFVGPLLASWVIDVEVRLTERSGQVVVGFQVRTTFPQWLAHGLATRECDALIADVQRLLPTLALATAAAHDPIVGPSQPVPEAFTGTLRDYSRCAGLDDLDGLRQGEFPLGRYLWPAEGSSGTLPLFLGTPETNGEPLIFRNVLVTAPVGTGKTTSIFRPWAVAAARAGFSTLLFDAKGDLAQTLREPLFAAGTRVVIFSTSPEQASVSWNFLDEVEIEPDGRLTNQRAIDAILDALLPPEAAGQSRSDNEQFAGQLFRGWLGAFIQIARYALGDAAEPYTLWQMAREKSRLEELLDLVRQRWPDQVYAHLYYEVVDLFDRNPWGYTTQLRGVANALAPFVHEPLRSRTRARAGQRRFRLADLERRPTTLILSCPLRDLEAARRVGSVATSLLVSHIYERSTPPPGAPDTRLPLLLLLDETRLLSARLNEFLAVGRSFKAGVVTCYQELDQIPDEATRRQILTNSTTLVALRGVGPGSRKAILERLARATVQARNTTDTVGEALRDQHGVNAAWQEVAVLGEYEMRALPGPRHAALVHVQDGSVANAKPILVDLTDNAANLPLAGGGRLGRTTS
jgi:Type IV secretory system Conjugative DNA transfer